MNKKGLKKILNAKETLIGIDYGEAKTGIALGRNYLVDPLQTFKNLSDETLIHEIIKTAVENRVSAFVLGIPLQADGKETGQSLKVRGFAKLLKILTKKPVFMQNEFGTTEESIREAISNGVPQSKRTKNDHLAAAMILKDFYREQNDL
jgi:putative Holliday junction resolvase